MKKLVLPMFLLIAVAIGIVPAGYSYPSDFVDAYTQKGGVGGEMPSPSFQPFELVYVYAQAIYNETPIVGKPVTFKGYFNSNIIFVLLNETNDFGIATIVFRIPWPWEASVGTWQIDVSAFITEGTILYDTVSFECVVPDINFDGIVNMKDVALVSAAYGSHPEQLRWNPRCDLYGDNKIDLRDIAIVARNFGQGPPNSPP